MNALCLVLDRLHAGYLGAYGNSWIETPTFDRFAFESFVFDQYLIDSPRLEHLYRSYWLGRHPLVPSPEGEPTLAEQLLRAGVTVSLVTDEPAVADHPLTRGFDPVVVIERNRASHVASSIDQTHFARCIAAVIDRLSQIQEPFLLWCHLAALGGPWDAPLEFRRQYAAEGDPEPPTTADVPCLVLKHEDDPDRLLGLSQCYAGQVSLADVCMAALLEWLDTTPLGARTLLLLTSARGFPLGEHGRVGAPDNALYGELVHVPLLMRFPDRLGSGFRTQALVQPVDLWATLADWWSLGNLPGPAPAKSLLPLVRGEVESLRDRLCLVGEAQRAIRVPAWYLRESGTQELFVKPDDRWEVNDVADRCADVVESLRAVLNASEEALGSGHWDALVPLDGALLTGPE